MNSHYMESWHYSIAPPTKHSSVERVLPYGAKERILEYLFGLDEHILLFLYFQLLTLPN